jgi:hypothetical protein
MREVRRSQKSECCCVIKFSLSLPFRVSLRHSYDRVRRLWNNPVQIAFKTKGALKKAK